MNKHLNEFIKHCKYEKTLASKTINFYRIDLNQFMYFLANANESIEVNEIHKEQIRSYIESLSNFKPKTIKRKLATLKSFFSFCEYEEFIKSNPFRKLKIKIKEPKQCPKTIPIHNIEIIIKRAHNEHLKNGSIISLRDLIVIELLFATGIRVSELSCLKSSYIDSENKTLKVMGKGSRERTIHISNTDILIQISKYKRRIIETLKAEPEYFLVNRNGNKLSDQSIRLIVKKFSKSIGEKGYITPHLFRHSLATLLIESNVDVSFVQKLLGHSSILTTQIYTHIGQSKQNDVIAKYHPRKLIKV